MTSIDKKKAELQLYEFLFDILEDRNHIYFSELQKKLEYEKPSVFKYFKCEYCIKGSISKYPDCFYISKLKDTVLLTYTTHVRKGYYSHYMNFALIGSVVTEVVTHCTSLIAKLELYNYLVQTLKINRVVFLDTVLAEIATYSEHCHQHFKCKHVIIEALEEFSDIFQINPITSPVFLDEMKWITANCSLDWEKNSLGTVFNCDCLLDIAMKTYTQLSAELQLYEISKKATVPPSCIQISELIEIVLKTSKACREYMSSCASMKTVLSLFPDIFYISRRNRLLQRHSVTSPAEDWYNVNRTTLALFDNLLFKLKEVFLKELATLKLVQITSALLKDVGHTSLANLVVTAKKNNYCRRYFHNVGVAKSALSLFAGIFHISKQNNIHLLENTRGNHTVCQKHDTISDSILFVVEQSCKVALAEIHMYCFLINQYCYILKDSQPLSLEILFCGLTSSSPLCKQIFTSIQQLKKSVQKYSPHFQITSGQQVCVAFYENEGSLSTNSVNSIASSNCSSSGTETPSERSTSQVDNFGTMSEKFSQAFQQNAAATFSAKLASDQSCSDNHISAFHSKTSTDFSPTGFHQLETFSNTSSSYSPGSNTASSEGSTVQANYSKNMNTSLLQTPQSKDNSTFHTKLASSQSYINNHVSVFHSKISSDFPPTGECATCETVQTITESGTMNSLFQTEGFVFLHQSNIVVPTIVDVVYKNCTGVNNLLDIDQQTVICMAVAEKGSAELNWKAALVWIGAKPANFNCAISSKSVWESIKNLYEERFKDNAAFIPASVNLNSCEIVKLGDADPSPKKDSKNYVELLNREETVSLISQKLLNAEPQQNFCQLLDEPTSSKLLLQNSCSIQAASGIDNINSSVVKQHSNSFFIGTSNSELKYNTDTKPQIIGINSDFDRPVEQNSIFSEQTDGACCQNKSLNNKSDMLENSTNNELVSKTSFSRTIEQSMAQQQNAHIEIFPSEDNNTQCSDVIVDLISNDSKENEYACCCIL